MFQAGSICSISNLHRASKSFLPLSIDLIITLPESDLKWIHYVAYLFNSWTRGASKSNHSLKQINYNNINKQQPQFSIYN